MNQKAAVVLSVLLLAAALPVRAARHALLVGCNDGGSTVDPLKWAESDAERFALLLTRLGGFEPSAVATLLNPDSAGLERELHRIGNRLRMSKTPESDLFLLYYSGHSDGRDMLLGKGRYPLRRIQSALDSLRAGIRIGVFDACQSGAVTAYKGGRRAEPFYLKNPQKIKGQVIIASAAASERAHESESLKGSIFSFYWLSGLRGSADISGDRRVTLDEAYRYAYRKTVETSTLTGGETQHPMYRFNIFGEGDITLTDLSHPGGGVLFDRTCEGKFLVLSESYTDIFADFFKKKNSESFVSLDPGTYRVVNANGGAVGTYNFTIDRGGGAVRLSQSMLAPNELTESRIKGVNPVADAAMSSRPTSPLSTHSWGGGAGLIASPFADRGGFGRGIALSFSNVFYMREHANLFVNARYITGGINLGADIGFDYLWSGDMPGFYSGAGAGLLYLENSGETFNESLAPALSAHCGYGTDIGKRTRIAIQVPYDVTFGRHINHLIGIEVKMLFTGPYRDVRVLRQ